MAKPVFALIAHKGEQRIQVSFEKNDEWNKRMKQVPGAKWSKTLRSWHIPDTEENRSKCGLAVNELPSHVASSAAVFTKTNLLYLSANNKEQLKLYLLQLQLKAYSSSTIRTY